MATTTPVLVQITINSPDPKFATRMVTANPLRIIEKLWIALKEVERETEILEGLSE